jgi:NAD(P)-dependent dehydrogenase (short-subunit alcohol dehydrogenase family)
MIGRLKCYVKNLYRFMRDGGVVYSQICFCNPGERLKGKKVLVTGGTSGIGRAVAEECLAEGADVLVCARGETRLKEVLDEIKSPKLHGIVWDISDVKSIDAKMNEAVSIMGGIDCFANCAGVSDFAGGNMKAEDTYDYILDINTKGLYFMCCAETRYFMETKKKGKIVNITSSCGDKPGFDPYTISKWGANCITKGLGIKMIEHGINVNGIGPGEVPTNITAHLQSHRNSENQFTPLHRTKRFTNAKEVARLAVYLLGGESSNMYGQVINMP